MNQRINYIDRMKGFAILVVVLAHVYIFTFGMSDCAVYRFCASFEMPLFMFVSGFVAYLSADWGGKICKKLTRRFVSYLCPAFVVTYALALYGYVILGNHDVDVVETLTGGYWYLKALAIFVCLQGILLRCRNILLELILICVAEVVFFVGWKTCPILHQLFCLEHCFFFFPFFMMGYYFRRYHAVDYVTKHNWVFTVSLIAFVCLLNMHFDLHALRFLSERMLRPAFAIVAITYIFAMREEKESWLEKWLNGIGTKTLDIYMYHMVLLFGAYNVFDLHALKDNTLMSANPVFFILIAMLLTVLLTYMSMWIGVLVRQSNLLEKIVYGKFLHR